MLISPPIQAITVDGIDYKCYVGNDFVSIETEHNGRKWFTCMVENRAVGEAIAATQKGLNYIGNKIAVKR